MTDTPNDQDAPRPETAAEPSADSATGSTATPPGKLPDPMKGFRGVMSAVLILEALVLLLALLVIAKADGVTGWQGGLVAGLALAMIGACAFVGRPWGIWLALGLQVVMIACYFVDPTLGGLGIAFALVWAWLVWLRRDVSRRMAAGTLRSQQTS